MDRVKLKKDAFLKLNLPITIELGEIKHLEIKVPWLNIGSSPVEVIIEGLYLIVSPQKRQLWQVIDIFDPTYLQNNLLAILNEVEQELHQEDNQGYFGKLAMKVLDNIQIRISNIHIRFEDHYSTDSSYTFGMVLQLLQVQTTNEHWLAQYIDRSQAGVNQNLFKTVVVQGFGIYLNPNDKFIIHQQTQHLEKRISLLEAIMQNQNEILQNILSPMNVRMNFEQQTKGLKKVSLTINLERIHVTFLKAQLKCLVKFFEIVTEFRKVQYNLTKVKKFKFLRPQQEKINSNNARAWWRFAYQSIKRSNKAQNGSIMEFIIPKRQMRDYEQQFVTYFNKFFEGKDNPEEIQWYDQERLLFFHILAAVDNNSLKTWIQGYLKPIVQKEEEATESQSFTSWLIFGSNRKNTGDKKRKMSDNLILNQAEMLELEKEVSLQQPEEYTKSLAINASLVIKDVIVDMGNFYSESDDVEGIRIFSKDTFVSFKTLPSNELVFDMEGSIGDFGVDLYKYQRKDKTFTIQESIIVSNKKIFPQNLEDQWRIRIRKRPDDIRNIEYDIDLFSNPFVAQYNKEFVKRATLLSQLGLNENTQSAAIDTFEDWREATSNQIYQIIYKKANRFRINIASPVIILPISGDSNPLSPVWILRLGDIQVVSHEHQLSTTIIEYEKYDFLIDSIRMQYFQNYDLWKKNLESIRNFRDKTITKDRNQMIFSVLEDCWVKFQISIKQKRPGLLMTFDQMKKHQEKPKVLLMGNSSDVKINLSHSIYNKLVNIGLIFDTSKDQDINKPQEEEMILSKQQVLKNAKKIGQIQKRLDPVKQWENYFCILSGGYLYFYKDAQQIMPSTYYYLKGATIEENNEDLALPHNIFLSNRYGNCCLALPNLAQFTDWSTKIRSKIIEIQLEDQQEFSNKLIINSTTTGPQPILKKNPKKVNHQSVQVQIDFQISNFKTLLVDELQQYKEWIIFELASMKILNIKRKSSTETQLLIKDIQLVDMTMKINSGLISQKQLYDSNNQKIDYNAFEMKSITTLQSNPKYENIDSEMNIIIDHLNIKFQPVTMNSILKFLRNTKYNKSFNLLNSEIQEEEDSFQSLILQSEAVVDENPQDSFIGSCSTIKEILSKMKVTFKDLSLNLLHNDYHMELYRVDTNELVLDYISKYDHINFGTKIKDFLVFDLTGYPYTINPKLYLDNQSAFVQNQREIIKIKTDSVNDYGLVVAFETYYSRKCELKRDGFSSKMSMYIKPLQIDYFQEAFMRFYNYFFEQFMNSLMYADPYSDLLKEEFDNIRRRKTIRRETIKNIEDFKQLTEILDMSIKIEELSLNIPDRPQSKNFISFKIGEMSVTQSLTQKPKRIQLKPEQKLYVKSFKINCLNSQFMFGSDNFKISEQPFSLKVTFENLAYSQLIQKIDPLIIEKASHVRLEFDPITLILHQDIYTQIQRCLDLNINFQDFMDKDYYFIRFIDIEEYYKQLKDVVSMRIKIFFKQLSMKMKHIDGSFLSELMLHNMSLNLVKHMDYSNKMFIKVQNFFIFEKEQTNKHNLPFNQFLKLIRNDDYVIQPLYSCTERHTANFFEENQMRFSKTTEYQLLVDMKMFPNGQKDIRLDVSGLRITIKPHVLMMVYYFFLNSFPEYDETSIDKPSYYYWDPEDTPRMDFVVSIQDSLLLLQNKPGLKTIACQGRIFFEMKRKNIKQVKEQFDEAHEEELSFDDEENKGFDSDMYFEEKITQAQNKQIWSMAVLVEDLCPFVCSVSQLNELEEFSRIKKRQLFTPFNLNYSTIYELVKEIKSNRGIEQIIYGCVLRSEIILQKIKMKISLQDLHLFFQIVTYANENVTNEYFKKLEKIDQFIKKQQNKQNFENFINDFQKFNRSQTIKNDFGIRVDDQLSQDIKKQSEVSGDYELEEQDKFQSILDNIQQNYDQTIASQVARFRSTTKAFSNIAHKYTSVTSRTSQLQRSIHQRDHNSYGNFTARQDTQNINRGDEDFKSAISSNLQSSTPNVQISYSTRPTHHLNVNNKLFEGSPNQNLDYHMQTEPNASRQSLHFHRLNVNQNYFEERKSRNNTFKSALQSPVDNESEDDDDLAEFEDARSEAFFSMHGREVPQQEKAEQRPLIQSNNQSKYNTPMNIATLNQEINEKIKNEIEIMEQQIKKEKKIYVNAMDNLVKQYYNYRTHGISILFINDYDNVFCPVLDIDMPDLNMKQESELGSIVTDMELSKMKIFYFNPRLGDWEPFLENLQLIYMSHQGVRQQTSKLDFPKPININMTESCLSNLIETYNSWMETPPYQYDDYSHRQRLMSSRLSISEKNQNSYNSKTGSLNDECKELENESGQIKLSESQFNDLNWINEANHIDKVSPYSIRNLTNYPIKIINGEQFMQIDFANEYQENQIREGGSLGIYDDPRISTQVLYEIEPGEEIEYAIDYEKQTSNLLSQNKRRRQALLNQSEVISTVPSHVSGIVEFKKKLKHEELVTVLFEKYQPIVNLDLNRIDSYKALLEPWVDPQDQSVFLDDDSVSKRETSQSKKTSRKSKFALVKTYDEIMYGVVLNKMRKILTIRNPYVIFNKTMMDYIIRITNRLTNVVKEHTLKTNEKMGLNMNFYNNHSIQIKIRKRRERSRQVSELIQEGYCQAENIENLLKLNLDSGKLLDHQDEILKPSTEEFFIGAPEPEETFVFDKGDEKHFHIFGYKPDSSTQEISFKFRLNGFSWSLLQLSFKNKNISESEDRFLKIRDYEGNPLDICARINSSSAGFNIIFYSYTVIINHSNHPLRFYYDSMTRPLLAGQDLKTEFCMANKDDPILACMNDKYSKAIKIKTAGIKDEFSIVTQKTDDEEFQFGGDNYQQRLNNPISHQYSQLQKKYDYVYQSYLSLVIESEFIYTKIVQISPKYILVNKMRSPLCIAQAGSEHQYYETIKPNERHQWVWPNSNLDEFVVIKKQDISHDFSNHDDLERSSSWFQMPEEDRLRKWKWSEKFKLNKMGILTIETKKNQNRFNNVKSRKIIRIIKKKIDATTYVIFEDEDKKYPFYKLENTSSQVSVWYIQKGQRFEEEACKLPPKTSLPFAFIDPMDDCLLQCYFIFNGIDQLESGRANSHRDEKSHHYDFERIGYRESMEYWNTAANEMKKLHVSVYTDGCTKIIRFSDQALHHEMREEKEAIARKSMKVIQDQEKQSSSNPPQILKTDLQLRIKEILFSFVTVIAEREQSSIKKSRREIAILTIQNIEVDQVTSSEAWYLKSVVGSIQIDNQSMVNPVFPTILQPRLFRTNEEQPMIVLEVNMGTENPQITYIDEINFTFSGMVIKCDDTFLGHALGFGYDIIDGLKTNLTGTHPIFRKTYAINPMNRMSHRSRNRLDDIPAFLQDQNLFDNQSRKVTGRFGENVVAGVIAVPSRSNSRSVKDPHHTTHSKQASNELGDDMTIAETYKHWMIKKIDTGKKKLYINNCVLSPLDIEISFLARKSFQLGNQDQNENGGGAMSIIQSTMNSWGLALISIDEAPMKIKPFNKRQFFQQQEDLSTIISDYYKDALKKNLIKLIGSTELLGNPRKFMKTIRNGLNDFYSMPFENAQDGIGAILKGTFLGTVSLMKNSVEGTFGFLQSITGSVSKSLLLMSMDKDYLSQREEKILTEKPKNIVEGVGYGCQSALNSLSSGLLGPITRPYKECRRNGILGIGTGIYSGATGLVLKPLSGGLDLMSKTNEGIKNTAKIFEAKLFKDRRRLPRALYGCQQQIKPYNDIDAYIVNRILNTIKDGGFRKDHYLETFKYEEGNRALFLLLSEEHLILLDAAQKLVWWHINSQSIKVVEKLQNGLIIKLAQKSGRRQVALEINDPQQLEKIFDKLRILENRE